MTRVMVGPGAKVTRIDPGWHKVFKDPLPAPGVEVLVVQRGQLHLAVWHPRIGTVGDFATVQMKPRGRVVLTHLPDVTHWMPLPALPL